MDGQPLDLRAKPGSRRRVRTLGFFAGIALALSLAYVVAFTGLSDSIKIQLLPAPLHDALILVQQHGNAVLLHPGTRGYEQVDVGSILPTHSISRRDSHIVSVSRGPNSLYEVRVDAQLVVSTHDTVTSAATSPDGWQVAWAQIDSQTAGPVKGDAFLALPSTVYLKEGTTSRMLGEGFAPFFLSNTEVAWFSATGLTRMDLTTGSSTTLAADITPAAWPAPAPAVSRDGTLIAWQARGSDTVKVTLVTPGAVQQVMSIPAAPGTGVAVVGSDVVTLEQTRVGTIATLHSGSTTERVYGLPSSRVMQLTP